MCEKPQIFINGEIFVLEKDFIFDEKTTIINTKENKAFMNLFGKVLKRFENANK